jgi:hypothetical protein
VTGATEAGATEAGLTVVVGAEGTKVGAVGATLGVKVTGATPVGTRETEVVPAITDPPFTFQVPGCTDGPLTLTEGVVT